MASNPKRVDKQSLRSDELKQIVAGTISSKADYLVSFDRKHLLQHKKEIEANFKIRMITPDELLK